VDMMDLRPNTEQVIVAVISGARRFHSVHVYWLPWPTAG